MSICVGNVRLALARSIQGWCGPTGASRGSHSAKVPYGVKQSAGYKESRLQRRLALEAARKQRVIYVNSGGQGFDFGHQEQFVYVSQAQHGNKLVQGPGNS